MDTMFRTDIGGMGSHGYHHHQHRHSPLIPMSHSPHRHVHRVYRRSAYVRLNNLSSFNNLIILSKENSNKFLFCQQI